MTKNRVLAKNGKMEFAEKAVPEERGSTLSQIKSTAIVCPSSSVQSPVAEPLSNWSIASVFRIILPNVEFDLAKECLSFTSQNANADGNL